MPNIEHLKAYQWKPGGPSPNAGGRGKRNPVSALTKELFDVPIPELLRKILNGTAHPGGRPRKGRPKKGSLNIPEGTTYGEAIVLSMFLRGIKGDAIAAKLVFGYSEGFPSKSVNISGNIVHEQGVFVAGLREKLNAMFAAKPEAEQLPEENKTHE